MCSNGYSLKRNMHFIIESLTLTSLVCPSLIAMIIPLKSSLNVIWVMCMRDDTMSMSRWASWMFLEIASEVYFS